MPAGHIAIRKAAVHNLKQIDLDLPKHALVVLCGVSGSGKTSLALDTLYAEGQRRYIETFALEERAFLPRLEKPAVERIDGLPVTVAVRGSQVARSRRATVGTVTEALDYLQLLFVRFAQLVCPGCGRTVRVHSPEAAARQLLTLPAGSRIMLGFVVDPSRQPGSDRHAWLADLRAQGFQRVLGGGQWLPASADLPDTALPDGPWEIVLDRLTVRPELGDRLRDSLETAFHQGRGQAVVWVQPSVGSGLPAGGQAAAWPEAEATAVAGHTWLRLAYQTRPICQPCGRVFADPEPRRLSFLNPLGACPTCEGLGSVERLDWSRIVPDPSRSLRQGAIAPWSTPAGRPLLAQWLAQAEELGLAVDQPFATLDPRQVELLKAGVPERGLVGLGEFFRKLEARGTAEGGSRLGRWRRREVCPACQGSRLGPEARAWRLDGDDLAQWCAQRIDQVLQRLERLSLAQEQRHVAEALVPPLVGRLRFLQEVGLGYLTLDRSMGTLSAGEAQRVALTSAMTSSLVNVLYVLDEPTEGLHPREVPPLVRALARLRDRGNSVLVVDHEEALVRAADEVVELGPGAGDQGGQVVFQGSVEALCRPGASLTGEYLALRRGVALPARRRRPQNGWIELRGARGRHLKHLTVAFPLNVLCVVTGVSGAGKSTLVEDTLYPALCQRKRKAAPEPLPVDDVVGAGQIEDCVLVDPSPLARSSRATPATYVGAWDPIREVFAASVDARVHNYTASHFSFNRGPGRCPTCEGEGVLHVDMQFLPDVTIRCPQCDGTRYRPEILAVTYRGRSIAHVLAMSVREAFSFFRGQRRVQARLKPLLDVGLGYLLLGQPVGTLSTGEAQRLKLAAELATGRRQRTLFLLDEPTRGLHFADVVTLLDCFESLLSVGHSLVVIEHNLQVIRAADYVIDLGPEGGEDGGRIVACGTPEEVAQHPQSYTGQALAASLADHGGPAGS
jgi:excinuclease ABC subunit A